MYHGTHCSCHYHMISVFNGRRRSIGEEPKELIYVQLSVAMRDYLHLFVDSSFIVFMCLALHSDEMGWSYPSIDTITEKTGRHRKTVFEALKHLRTMEIEGHRVLLSYQPYTASGTFTSSRYLLFPTPAEVAHYEGLPCTVKIEPPVPLPIPPCTLKGDTVGIPPCTLKGDTKYNHLSIENNLSEEITRENETPAGILALEQMIEAAELTGVYNSLDLQEEARKAEFWYNQQGKKFTKRAFLSWLNRALNWKTGTTTTARKVERTAAQSRKQQEEQEALAALEDIFRGT